MKTAFTTAIVMLLVVPVFALTAPMPMGTTVLVVPARYSVLQVAFDVSDRMGAPLVAYQGDARSQTPVIDYWAGQEWKRLSLEDYAQASFVQGRIARFVIVGHDEILPPVLVSSVAQWCGDIQRITALDTPGLVNSFGKIFNFSSSEWEWFAKRYNLQLADRNAQRRQQSWYDRDYYDDELAHRWQWLRRKYNPPATQPPSPSETEPVATPAPAEPATEAPVPPEAAMPGTPEPPSVQAPSYEEQGEIERLDVPVMEQTAPVSPDNQPVEEVEPVVAPQEPPEGETAGANAPKEEVWPVK
jgi:hypothetical protein